MSLLSRPPTPTLPLEGGGSGVPPSALADLNLQVPGNFGRDDVIR